MTEELPTEPDGHKSIEEQKTRLWALSFESTKQLLRCENCGATNVIPRLVADPSAVPMRRASDRVAFAKVEEQKKVLSQERKAVYALSAVSAALSVAVIALLFGRKNS